MATIKVSVIMHDKSGRILLQLRDEELEKGKWVLFGGSVEKEDQSEEEAVKREIEEELCYRIKDLSFFKRYKHGSVEQPIYVISKPVSMKNLKLKEGACMRFFKPADLRSIKIGFNYKEIIQDYLNQKSTLKQRLIIA